jgi:hypothetical protein
VEPYLLEARRVRVMPSVQVDRWRNGDGGGRLDRLACFSSAARGSQHPDNFDWVNSQLIRLHRHTPPPIRRRAAAFGLSGAGCHGHGERPPLPGRADDVRRRSHRGRPVALGWGQLSVATRTEPHGASGATGPSSRRSELSRWLHRGRHPAIADRPEDGRRPRRGRRRDLAADGGEPVRFVAEDAAARRGCAEGLEYRRNCRSGRPAAKSQRRMRPLA